MRRPKRVFELYFEPKNSLLGSQQVKNDPKGQVKAQMESKTKKVKSHKTKQNKNYQST